MFILERSSFRQMLLLAFLLIAVLLGAVLLAGLSTLENLVAQANAGAERSVQLGADAQSLIDRSTSMERAARQYVVLDDDQWRQRFENDAREADKTLNRLLENEAPADLGAAWRDRIRGIRDLLGGPRS